MVINTPCIDHGCKGMGLGYATAWITVDGRRFTTTKHRAVFLKAHGFLPEVVEHLCNNSRCINVEHLAAGTHKSNAEYKYKCGRGKAPRATGECSACCKLTDAEVAEIRRIYVRNSREFGLPALARRYGVGTSQLHRILTKGHRSGPSVKEVVPV